MRLRKNKFRRFVVGNNKQKVSLTIAGVLNTTAGTLSKELRRPSTCGQS